MFSGLTPTKVKCETTESLLTVEVVDYEAFRDDRLYEPLRALVRIVLRSLMSPSNAVILGSTFVEYLVPDQIELGWQEGLHYVPTCVEVWQGLKIGDIRQSWFLKECPLNLPPDDFDQLIINDSLCILCNYRGPAQIDEVLSGLSGLASEAEIAQALLTFCDSVALSDSDGVDLRVIAKKEDFLIGN